MACGAAISAGKYAPLLEELEFCDTVWARCNRAMAHLELEMYRACLRECESVLKTDPSCLRAYHLRALAYRSMGKHEEAIKVLLKGLEVGADGKGDLWVYRDLLTMKKELEGGMQQASTSVSGAATVGPSPSAAPVVPASIAFQMTIPAAPAAPVMMEVQQAVSEPRGDGPDALDEMLSKCEVPKEVLEQVRSSLSFASGVPAIDDGIALGYLKVNTGKHAEALDLFHALLQRQPRLIAARLGRGSALALMGRLQEGVEEFSAAIAIDPSVADAWKRRGQTRSAVGDVSGAVSDLNKAVELDPQDVDTYCQRGLVLHKHRDFRRALVDLRRVVAGTPSPSPATHSSGQQRTEEPPAPENLKVVWNFVGLCEANLGHVSAALEAYDQALRIDPGFKEARLNKAQLLRDAGRGDEAVVGFDETLQVDRAYVQAYYLKGLCLYGLGRVREAHKTLGSGLVYDPLDLSCRHWLGIACQALGLYADALQAYDQVLSLVSSSTNGSIDGTGYHVAWYHRELGAYWWARLDRPLSGFNPDAELDPQLKEGWCKGHKPWELKNYTPIAAPKHVPDLKEDLAALESQPLSGNGVVSAEVIGSMGFLLSLTRPLGTWIQLDECAGFLTNTRQHRMCGLAALEIAQTVRQHWDSLKEGGLGVTVPNPMASAPTHAGSRGGLQAHPLGWRDVFDIAVRWRQLSEPNDPVWWIDRLVPESFADGFGLQTPLVNGQLKVIRYHPYFDRAFALLRSLLAEQLASEAGTQGAAPALDRVGSLETLHSLVQHDFWVTTPCHSSAYKQRVLEGTRLTVVASPPEGFEFTIRTPGTPPRWQQYDEELRLLWCQLTSCYVDGEEDVDGICDLIWTMFYYWCNFGPLSRGSAACGYVVALGLMLAMGMKPGRRKGGVQLDWEAILTPTPERFLETVRDGVYGGIEGWELDADWPKVAEVFDTPRKVVLGLNLPWGF